MKTTAYIMTALVIFATVYDIIVIQFGGIDYSISRWVQNMGFDSPMISFGCGFLAGHFFGYMKPKNKFRHSPSLVNK